MTAINADIDRLNLPDSHVYTPKGFNAHYRISSDELRVEKSLKKIERRIHELKFIEKVFKTEPISEIIIADCESVEDVDIMSSILKKTGLQAHVVPLIECKLEDKVLKGIMEANINKIMFAGSDSIQRETYVGALIIKLQIQKLIIESKQEGKITFFEGTGSRVNRNGCLFESRMGTILEGIQYERTIQGKQR